MERQETDSSIERAVRATLDALDKKHTAARKKRLDTVVSRNELQRLFAALEAFNRPYRELEDGNKRRPPQKPNDYPASINGQIYEALKQQLECDRYQSCTCAGSPRLTRLCLRPRITLRDEDVLFDVVFSGGLTRTSRDFEHWQLVRFLLSRFDSRSSFVSMLETDLGIKQQEVTLQAQGLLPRLSAALAPLNFLCSRRLSKHTQFLQCH